MRTEKAFSWVRALLTFAAIALICFGTWFAWHTGKVASDKEAARKRQNPALYIPIPDLKVRLPKNDIIKDLTFGPVQNAPTGENDKLVTIIAPQLDPGWKCAVGADGVKGTIGAVSVTYLPKRAGPGDPAVTKTIRGYTYGFEPGGTACSDDPQYQALVDAFKKQFNQLTAY